MKKQIKQLKLLDSLFHIRLTSKNSSKRRIWKNGKRQDAVSKLLAKCQLPSEIGIIAVEFGITIKEVVKRAKSAPNFGQFRMVVGNRIRGIVSREISQRHKNYIRSNKTAKI